MRPASRLRAFLPVLALLVLAGPAFACSCIESALRILFRESPDVFVGKVLYVKQSGRVPVPKGVVVRVRVVESWKGVRPGQVFDIATGSGGGDCGYDFEDALARGDSTHLLFARPVVAKRSLLATDICT